MKRFNNIYKEIYSIENLETASQKAQRGKKWYEEVEQFNEHKDILLLDLQWNLQNKQYQTSPYEVFKKMCGKKEREIYKLPFYPDRICQWAIMLQLEKLFIRNFTRDTYSAIPKRGIHLALKRMKKEIRSDLDGTKYCLKLDVKKYYPNIDHEVLKFKLTKIFKDKDLLWLLGEIIDSLPNGKGLPIGNYTSQYLANFYLSGFDHWLKEGKKCKYVYRYMDDVVILSDNKEFLHDLLKEIKVYLSENLKLELKGNEQIFPTEKRGIDFVGYVIYPTHVELRKSIKTKMISKMRLLKDKSELTENDLCSVNSYKGWLQHCNSLNLQNKYLTLILNKEVIK